MPAPLAWGGALKAFAWGYTPIAFAWCGIPHHPLLGLHALAAIPPPTRHRHPLTLAIVWGVSMTMRDHHATPPPQPDTPRARNRVGGVYDDARPPCHATTSTPIPLALAIAWVYTTMRDRHATPPPQPGYPSRLQSRGGCYTAMRDHHATPPHHPNTPRARNRVGGVYDDARPPCHAATSTRIPLALAIAWGVYTAMRNRHATPPHRPRYPSRSQSRGGCIRQWPAATPRHPLALAIVWG
ncbi:hypothetical protein BC826DRAFT_363636 [Russula brevipes]|nr:hypothetical protein BC826DRAFT_363636 [Russula brevipes]